MTRAVSAWPWNCSCVKWIKIVRDTRTHDCRVKTQRYLSILATIHPRARDATYQPRPAVLAVVFRCLAVFVLRRLFALHPVLLPIPLLAL